MEVEKEGNKDEEMESRMDYVVRIGKITWKIVCIYVNGDLRKKIGGIKEWIEKREEGKKTIIGISMQQREKEENREKRRIVMRKQRESR